MKAINPVKKVAAGKFDGDDQKVPLKALMNGLTATDNDLSFDDIRTALGKTVDELPDGSIHQILLDEGFEVEVG